MAGDNIDKPIFSCGNKNVLNKTNKTVALNSNGFFLMTL